MVLWMEEIRITSWSMVYPIICRVSTIRSVMQDFATIHSISKYSMPHVSLTHVQFQYSWQYTQCHTRNFSSHAASVLHAAATLLHIAEGVLLREARHCRRWRDVVSQLRVLAMLGLAWTISWWNFQIIKLTFAMLHHPHGFIVSTTSHKYMVKTWGMVDPILFYHNFLWLYIHSGKLT